MDKCEKCGMILNDDCVVAWKCKECGKAFEVTLGKLRKIQELKSKNADKHLLKCSSCGCSLDDGDEKIICKCSVCGNVSGGNLEYFTSANKDTDDEKINDNNQAIDLIECPECGKKILKDSKLCSYCGYPLGEKKSFHKSAKSLLLIAVILVALIVFFVIKAFPKCEHEYDEGIIKKEATCVDEGIKTFTCKLCSEEKTETIPLAEHTYDSGEITKEASCTEEGEKTLTCKLCGNEKVEPIKIKNHEYEEKIIKEATFEEEGIKTFICKNCGDSYTESILVRDDKVVLTVEEKINYEQDTSAWRFQPFVELICKIENMTDKDIKGISGKLIVNDLFGKHIITIDWDITGQNIPANGSITQKDYGVEINQFMDEHMRLYNTDYDDLKFEYKVKQIVYTDGTVESL